jgi:outer membrane protein assembly factor BamB
MIFGRPGSDNSGRLATWQDAEGNRWVYANFRDSVRAFRLTPGQREPEFTVSWQLSGLHAPGPPILANGILYFLSSAGSAKGTDAARQTGAGLACPSGGTPHTAPVLRTVVKTSASNHLVLHAMDALQGTELYNSGESICSSASSKNLAIANGHICFSAADGWLYCFGIPFQM